MEWVLASRAERPVGCWPRVLLFCLLVGLTGLPELVARVFGI